MESKTNVEFQLTKKGETMENKLFNQLTAVYIDVHGSIWDHCTQTTCAYSDGTFHYAKCNSSGFFFDPTDSMVRPTDLIATDRQTQHPLYEFVHVNDEVYRSYVKFLSSRAKIHLLDAQKMYRNTEQVKYTKKETPLERKSGGGK